MPSAHIVCPFCSAPMPDVAGMVTHAYREHPEMGGLLSYNRQESSKQVKPVEEIKANQSRIGKSNVRRSKGHERQVAKWLTEWSGQEFRRRRVEGRDVTVIERESTADVIPVKGDVHCSIEAKCGAVCTFAALMENPKGTKMTEWWHQACYDVTLVSQVLKRPFFPMMFFRPYLNQNWVAISARLFTQKILKPRRESAKLTAVENSAPLVDARPVWFPHLLFDAYDYIGDVSFNVVRTKNPKNFKFVPLRLDSMVMCRWKDFAAHVDPTSFFINSITPPQNYNMAEGDSDGV